MSDRSDAGVHLVTPILRRHDFNVFRAGYAEQVDHGFKPRRDTRPVRLELPLNWDMDPLNDRNWCFQLHAWRMLQPIWTEFYGRDWGRLKGEVMPWIRDWHSYHVQQGRKSRFMWYDMATGLRAQHLALLIHLQQQGRIQLEGPDQQRVDELAALHIAKLRDASFISKGNHGIFQLVGLRLLGVVWNGRPETEGEEAYTSQQMRELVESQFGPDGVHVENSPAYHNFAIIHFGRIRPELFPSIAGLLARTLASAREVAPWFSFPDGSIAAIGDSEGSGQEFSHSCGPDAESSSKWGDRVLMRDLSRGGYVSIRTDPQAPPHRQEMLIVKGQAFTLSHAHADHLGFELFAHGRPLFVDSGKYTYNKCKWREYFTSDRAHNVVGLAKRSFSPSDTGLGSSGLEPVRHEDGVYKLEGKISRGPDFVHRRVFQYRPGASLKLREEVLAPVGRAPVAYFHLAEHLDAVVEPDAVAIFSGGRRLATLVYPSREFEAHLVRGQEKPAIQGWVSPTYGERRPATAIELRGRPQSRSWVIEIRLHEPKAPEGFQQQPLPHGVVIPFLGACRTDRMIDREEVVERRLLIEYYSGSPSSVIRTVTRRLAASGYEKVRSRPEQGGVRTYYRHGDGTRLTCLARPAETFPVRAAGAVGSLYMSFTAPIDAQGRPWDPRA